MTGPLAGDSNKKPQYYYSAAFESNQNPETLSSAFVKYLLTQYGVQNEVDGPSRHAGGGCWTVDSWTLSDAQAFIDKELMTSSNNHKPPVSWPNAVTTSWAYSGKNIMTAASTKRAMDAKTGNSAPGAQSGIDSAASTDTTSAKKKKQAYDACMQKWLKRIKGHSAIDYQQVCGAAPPQ